jgi:hypothetical protein
VKVIIIGAGAGGMRLAHAGKVPMTPQGAALMPRASSPALKRRFEAGLYDTRGTEAA